MNIPPLHEWHRHQDGFITYLIPHESESTLAMLKGYWTSPWPTLQCVREHKWGGHVLHGTPPSMDTELYFKRFAIKSPRYIHKPSRARATVLNERRMRSLGFNTAPLVGLIEKRVAGILVDSAVISEALCTAHPAYAWYNTKEAHRLTESIERKHLTESIAQCIAAFHSAGLFHGDMHVGNILCDTQDASNIQIYWLDNEEGKHFSTLPWSKRIHDLTHILRFTHFVPKEEQKIFWDTYTKHSKLAPPEVTTLTQTLMHQTRRFWKKKKINYSWEQND